MVKPLDEKALREKLQKAFWTFCEANPDDLNSPEDLPDHTLMTAKQFSDYAFDVFIAQIQATQAGESEAVAAIDRPDKLWLSAPNDDQEHEVWFDPDEGGTEYVRADIITAAQADHERLRRALQDLATEMRFMLRLNPSKDGGLYRKRLDEADAALAGPEKPKPFEDKSCLPFGSDVSNFSNRVLTCWERIYAARIDEGYGEHSGSPGEGDYEDYAALEAEMKKRGLTLTPKPGNAALAGQEKQDEA